MSSKIKQFGLAWCLVASLLIGHASGCTCSHHEQGETAEANCHSHHDTDGIEPSSDDTAVDDECTCAVESPTPSVAARSINNDIHPEHTLADLEAASPEFELSAAAAYRKPPLASPQILSYSSSLKSPLPSRAPPRL